MRKTFYAHQHQNKEAQFVKSLISAGFSQDSEQTASVILADVDTADRVSNLCARVVRGNVCVFVYPHAARPNLFWDGFIEPWEHTSGVFVFAEGHKKVLELYGYNKPIHVCGWAYSKIKQFKPKAKIKNILFAPIHPTRSGYLPGEDKRINTETFGKILSYCKKNDAKLTVRHIDSLDKNGIWREDGVKYVNGNANIGSQEEQILNSDLVVARETFLWIAVALGVPSLAMSEQTTPKFGKDEKHLVRVSSWDKYKHLVCYPLDIFNGAIDESIEKASLSDVYIREWKEQMIGDEFDGSKVSDVILRYTG